MIEAYLFHAMFAVQILLGSVLIPRKVLRLSREALARSRTPLPPGGEQWVQRTIKQFRVANGVVVAIGLVLLGFLFFYMTRADWDDGPVEVWLAPYFVLQCLPFFVISLCVARANKELQGALPVQRKKAVLQRRSLFDFVSPVVVGLALLCYPVFIAMVFYIQRNPFSGFAGPAINIGVVTLEYVITATVIYFVMYGRNRNSQQTHTERMHQMERVVNFLVYTCLISVVGLMVNFALVMVDRQRLEPFALTTSFVIIGLALYWKMHAAPASPAAEVHTRAAH